MPPFPPSHLPMMDVSNILLKEDATIMQAIACIDSSDAKIVLVNDASGKLVGSATDGDIRRAFLKGATLESPISGAMHTKPYTLAVGTPRNEIIETLKLHDIRQVPLVDAKGAVVGIVTLDQLTGLAHPPRTNPVVIMAGGKGQRLMPLTTNCPKPMVDINGKPMLEWMLQRFVLQGFHEFHIAINYLGHMIEEYFGDGSAFGCHITYIREQTFLGTAGALSLLTEKFDEPLLVINGDIMASIDFADVVDFHESSNAIATVCARPHRVEVPYGVIEMRDGVLHTIVEKPVHEDLISAGIYVLDPRALSYIEPNTVTDMPSVLLTLARDAQKVAVFPMREEWLDVGRHEDLELAKRAVRNA